MDRIKSMLSKKFDLGNIAIKPTKGGWIAKAFIVVVDNRQYFLKQYDKRLKSTIKWTKNIDTYTYLLQYLAKVEEFKNHIPKPVFTIDNQCKVETNDYIYLLYEWIIGEVVGEDLLAEKEAEELAFLVSSLHNADLNRFFNKNIIPKYKFGINDVTLLEELVIVADELAPNIQTMLNNHKVSLEKAITHYKYLANKLKKQDNKFVLCHRDIHYWNIMRTKNGLVLLDFEGIELAPKEADLMFFLEAQQRETLLKKYFSINKYSKINEDAMEFYQLERKLEDIWEWLELLVVEEVAIEKYNEALEGLEKEIGALVEN